MRHGRFLSNLYVEKDSQTQRRGRWRRERERDPTKGTHKKINTTNTPDVFGFDSTTTICSWTATPPRMYLSSTFTMIRYAAKCIQMCRFPLLTVTCKTTCLIPLTTTALSAATSRKSRSDCMSMRQGHAPWFYCSCGSTRQTRVGIWSLYRVWNLVFLVKRKQKNLAPNIETKFIQSHSHLVLPTKSPTCLLSVPSGITTKSTNDLQPHADIIAVHTSFNTPSPPLQTILITKVSAGTLTHYRSG